MMVRLLQIRKYCRSIRIGVKAPWGGSNFATAITVAHKIPADLPPEDAKFLMWYDQALTRSGEE